MRLTRYLLRYQGTENSWNIWNLSRFQTSVNYGISCKTWALSEDRTHNLQIALIHLIMRLMRYLLRYQGTEDTLNIWNLSRFQTSVNYCISCKTCALGKDWTHDLQIAQIHLIIRLTCYLLRYQGTENSWNIWNLSRFKTSLNYGISCKTCALSEDRTHDLQIALIHLIMRLTRYLLRYQGTENRWNILNLSRFQTSVNYGISCKTFALSKDRTHYLQIALIHMIMRLTRYLLRYQGTHAHVGWEDLRMNCPRYLHNMDTFVRKHELLSYSLSKNDAHYQ